MNRLHGFCTGSADSERTIADDDAFMAGCNFREGSG